MTNMQQRAQCTMISQRSRRDPPVLEVIEVGTPRTYLSPTKVIPTSKETKKRFLQLNVASLQCSRIQEVILKHFGIVQDLAFGGWHRPSLKRLSMPIWHLATNMKIIKNQYSKCGVAKYSKCGVKQFLPEGNKNLFAVSCEARSKSLFAIFCKRAWKSNTPSRLYSGLRRTVLGRRVARY